MSCRIGSSGYEIEAFPSSASKSLVSSAPGLIVLLLEAALKPPVHGRETKEQRLHLALLTEQILGHTPAVEGIRKTPRHKENNQEANPAFYRDRKRPTIRERNYQRDTYRKENHKSCGLNRKRLDTGTLQYSYLTNYQEAGVDATPFERGFVYTTHGYKGRKNRNTQRNSTTAYKIHLGRLPIIQQSNQTYSISNNEQEETTPSHWLPVQENTQIEKDRPKKKSTLSKQAYLFLVRDNVLSVQSSFASSVVNSVLVWNIFKTAACILCFLVLAFICIVSITQLCGRLQSKLGLVRKFFWHKYTIFGDDIVIADPVVAEVDSSALSRLGVTIAKEIASLASSVLLPGHNIWIPHLTFGLGSELDAPYWVEEVFALLVVSTTHPPLTSKS
ncbi:hypothetical protein M9H77_13716 [Catharanthus roseus]|uniref:Uncharacterized protein n=1 Tax=Catharanthus roseus TaxID=4058 RepID=A0ACC0BL54_CATRO|nr:hypothetical protein M9H77_13716 [Catharanthus roseus]